MQKNPSIRRHLLWEYDWSNLNFQQMAVVVIERVIERGNLSEWREIMRFYGKEKIKEAAEKSTRLDEKHKNFTSLFLKSDFFH